MTSMAESPNNKPGEKSPVSKRFKHLEFDDVTPIVDGETAEVPKPTPVPVSNRFKSILTSTTDQAALVITPPAQAAQEEIAPEQNPLNLGNLCEWCRSIINRGTFRTLPNSRIYSAFRIDASRPYELFAKLNELEVQISGGNGSSRNQAIKITGNLDSFQLATLRAIIIARLRDRDVPAMTREEHPESGNTYETFKFSGLPDLYLRTSLAPTPAATPSTSSLSASDDSVIGETVSRAVQQQSGTTVTTQEVEQELEQRAAQEPQLTPGTLVLPSAEPAPEDPDDELYDDLFPAETPAPEENAEAQTESQSIELEVEEATETVIAEPAVIEETPPVVMTAEEEARMEAYLEDLRVWQILAQNTPKASAHEKAAPTTSPAPSPSWLQKHFGKLFAATAATVGIGLAVAPTIKEQHAQEVEDGTREKVEELDNLVFNAIKKAAAELKAIAPEKLLADTKIRFNHRPSLTVRDAKADTDYAHSVDEFPWIERTAPGDIVIDERNEVELMSAEGGVLTVKDTSIQGIYHEKNKNTVVVKIALPEGDDVQLRQYQTSGYYKKLGGKRSAFIAFDVSTGKLMNTYVGYNNYDSQSNGEALNLNSSSTGVYSGVQEIFKALKPIIELGMTNPTEALKELTENGMPVETNAQGRLSGLNIMSQKKGNLVGYFIDFDIDISGKHIPQMFSDYVGQADFHYKGGREDIVPNKDAAEVGGKRATQKIFSDEFIYIGFEGQEPFAFYSIPKNGSIGAGLQHDLKLLAEGPNQLLHPYVVSQHDFDVFKRQRGTNQHGFWPVSSFLDQLH